MMRPAAPAPSRPYVIALEEHYSDPEVAAQASQAGVPADERRAYGLLVSRLHDLGTERLAEMDAASIDRQVISHAPSPIQQVEPELARRLAVATNDRLHDAIDRNPERFAGFAALPTPDPAAAVAELDRTVTRLGFKGAMIHGQSRGAFHDDRRFWPIFERAQALDVPIYLHPGPPHQGMVQAYYADYAADFPSLNAAAWGFTVDTASQAVRLILSGLFETYPRLKIILGHLGEGLPFLVDRVDEALRRPGNRPVAFKETFCRNFYLTTSGHFSTPALLCALLELGIDRLMFSVDYPFAENLPGVQWLRSVPLSPDDAEKLSNGNARRLLKL